MVEIRRHLAIRTEKGTEQKVCIKQKQASKTGWICDKIQRRKMKNALTHKESNEVWQMVLNTNGIFDLSGLA